MQLRLQEFLPFDIKAAGLLVSASDFNIRRQTLGTRMSVCETKMAAASSNRGIPANCFTTCIVYNVDK